MFFCTVRLRTIIIILAIPLLIFASFRGYHKVLELLYPFPYRDIVTKYSIENGLDPFLVAAVIKTESGFHPDAESHKEAVGLMQLQPSTARWCASKMGLPPVSKEQLRDKETNVKIGCWYLKNLLIEFNGNIPEALAAYNGGRGNVRRWVKEGVWDGKEEHANQIPFWETRGFVRKVLKNWVVYTKIYGGE